MMKKANTVEPQDALNLLNQASAQLSANREVHDKIKEAVHILDKMVKEYVPKSDSEE